MGFLKRKKTSPAGKILRERSFSDFVKVAFQGFDCFGFRGDVLRVDAAHGKDAFHQFQRDVLPFVSDDFVQASGHTANRVYPTF